MSTDGWLPPGTTDADIDRAAPGYDEPLFYCESGYWPGRWHCINYGFGQCPECEMKASERNADACTN